MLVLDFVGVDATLELASKLAGNGGRVAIVGAGGGTIPMGFSTFRPEVSIVAPRWGTIPELVEVVALAKAGVLDVHVERFALDQALDAYGRMREGRLLGRAVVTADV
jgi:propanol-preferring alcohol dehydrogenase